MLRAATLLEASTRSNLNCPIVKPKLAAGAPLITVVNEISEEKYRELQIMRYNNSIINSPTLKKLVSSSVEGRSVLKSEIAESNARVMSIKSGRAID